MFLGGGLVFEKVFLEVLETLESETLLALSHVLTDPIRVKEFVDHRVPERRGVDIQELFAVVLLDLQEVADQGLAHSLHSCQGEVVEGGHILDLS